VNEEATQHEQRRRRSPEQRRRSSTEWRSSVARLAGTIFEAPSGTTVLRRDRVYRFALVAADLLAAVLAMVVAVTVAGDDELRLPALLAAAIVVPISKVIGLYDRDDLVLRKSTLDESPALFQLSTLYALGFWLLSGTLVIGRLANGQVLALWGLLFAFALVGRWVARKLADAFAETERCLVVGDLRGSGAIEEKLEAGGPINAAVVAHLPLDLDGDRGAALQRLEQAIRRNDAHRVILAPRAADSDAVLDAIRLIKGLGVRVSLLPRLFEVVGSSVVFDDLNGVTVLGVRRFGLTRSSARVKRATDLLGAGLGILATAPIMVLLAVLIRLDSHGPVFFRQDRVGRNGRPFEMLKFRSMVDGAEARRAELEAFNESDGVFKIADDPRVTRVGRFLRKTSLDELPQLLNVVRGDMSLVGPRPLVADEDALVQGFHRRRLHLTPGMTGPWQILGARKVPLQEMVTIDYLYIANWSLWTDVKIMLRTVVHMLSRRGM
jgi:exopolysaccharide biosynthesis polyprenyl glycosylphosphotransferase